jgi:hypothetical protein
MQSYVTGVCTLNMHLKVMSLVLLELSRLLEGTGLMFPVVNWNVKILV